MRLLALLILILVGHAIAAETTNAPDKGFAARCKDNAVVTCFALDSEAEIGRFRFSPQHLEASNRIQCDANAKAARFTVPPLTPADSAGQLHIPLSQLLADVYFSGSSAESAGSF